MDVQEIPGKIIDIKGNSELCGILSFQNDFYTIVITNSTGQAVDSELLHGYNK